MASKDETKEEKDERLFAAHCAPMVLHDNNKAGRNSTYSSTGDGSINTAGSAKERQRRCRANKAIVVAAAAAAAAGSSSSSSSSSSLSLSLSSSLHDDVGSVTSDDRIIETVTKTVHVTEPNGKQIVTTETRTIKRPRET